MVGVGPESESELESDNRNCQESESESDDGTSDSAALVTGVIRKQSTVYETQLCKHKSLKSYTDPINTRLEALTILSL